MVAVRKNPSLCGLAALVVAAGTACTNIDAGSGDDDDEGVDGGVPTSPCDQPSLDLTVATIAGCGEPALVDGPRAMARFSDPVTVEAGAGGIIYVADFDNGVVREIDADGRVRTLVQQEGFSRPFALLRTSQNVLYVETDDNDAGEHTLLTGTIWKVDLSSGHATVIVRNVGRPRGMAELPDGNLILSDHMHHCLQTLNVHTGAMKVVAGSWNSAGFVDGAAASSRLSEPYGLAVGADGLVYFTDYDNHRIRSLNLSTNTVATVAGTSTAGHADGAAASAKFANPQDLVIGPDGTIYVSDRTNRDIRAIKDGMVTTIAGNGVAGWHDDDDPMAASFYGLEGIGLSLDASLLLIADGNQGDGSDFNRIRIMHLDHAAAP